jgi:hypothetical protein
MNYHQAAEFKYDNKKIFGELIDVLGYQIFVRYMLIAPTNLNSSEVVKVLNENILKPIDNETALRNLKLLQKSLSVFLIGAKTKGIRERESLHVLNLEKYLDENITD